MTAQSRSHDLDAIYPPPAALAVDKELDRLDVHARGLIALSPFVVIATAGAGYCDASPRGDRPGFVRVLDDRRLAIPDRPGNNRIDSWRNLAERPELGLLFLVPGLDETLRVRGRGALSLAPELMAACAVEGRPPRSVLVVAVASAFYHCGKCMRRSDLWTPAAWPDRSALPSFGRVLADQVRGDATALDAKITDGYATRLY